MLLATTVSTECGSPTLEDAANGVPGGKIINGFSLNLGSYLFLVKAPTENCCVHVLTNTLKGTEHHYLAQYSFTPLALIHIAFSSFTRTLFF